MPLFAAGLLALGSTAALVVVKKENEATIRPKLEALDDMTAIQNALVAYQRQHHSLPCPAPRAGANTGISAPDCSIAGAGNQLRAVGGSQVHIGALPYMTLKMGTLADQDSYSNRFTYAVLINFASPFTYSTAVGGLTVTGAGVTNAAYVVISHGADGKGAFSGKAGIRGKACATTAADGPNCDDLDGTFRKSDLNPTLGTSFFDDAIIWGVADTQALSTNRPCLNGSMASWTVDNGLGPRNCSAPFSALPALGIAHGGTSASHTNTATNRTGASSFTCNDGVLTQAAGATCVGQCPAPLAAQVWSAHSCTGTPTGSLTDGQTQSVTNTAPGRTGSVTVTCGDGGTLTQSDVVCNPSNCTGGVHNWGAGCTGSSTTSAHGTTPTVNDSLTAGGYTGSIALSCQYGAWSTTSSACYANCAVSARSWGAPSSGTPCTGNAPLTAHNTVTPIVVNNTLANHSGSLELTCNNGSWVTGNASCVYTTSVCPPTAIGWGSGCSRSIATMNNGDTLNGQANTASGYTGSANIACTAGVMSVTGSPTCNANCTAQSINWSTNCTGSASAMDHGAAAQTVTNTATGYTGDVNVTCNNGTLSQAGATCSAIAGTNGNLYCWGYGAHGQIGDNMFVNRSAPMTALDPAGVDTWKSISSGMNSSTSYTCGIAENDQIYCWGYNNVGQLGDGTTTNRGRPTAIVKPGAVTSWTRVSATGHATVCAIANTGNLYCWGHNSTGQVGDGTTAARYVPTLVSKPAGVTSWLDVSTGMNSSHGYTCALGNNTQIYCWGYNNVGQLGDGTTTTRYSPSNVVTLPVGVTGWTKMHAGGHANGCAIANTGNLYCWGNNSAGQIGDGTYTDRYTPVLISKPSGVSNWTEVSLGMNAGTGYSCALGNNGRAYCWGINNVGQLGDGTTTTRTTPKIVNLPVGVTSFSQLATNYSTSCAIGDNNRLYCWGYNNVYQVGDGTQTNRANPTAVALPFSGAEFTASAPGHGHTCGLVSGSPPPVPPGCDGSGGCYDYCGCVPNGDTTRYVFPNCTMHLCVDGELQDYGFGGGSCSACP